MDEDVNEEIEELEDGEIIDEGYAENPSYEQWVGEVNPEDEDHQLVSESETSSDEVHEKGFTDEEVTGEVKGLQEHTVVQRCDFKREGDEIKPIDDVNKEVLARLQEVHNSKIKDKVPSLKCY